MTYRNYYGLGQTTDSPIVLPSFESLPKEGVRYNVPWALVSDDAILNQIKQILVRARAMAPGEAIRNNEGKLKDDGVFINALRSLWTRLGRNPNQWPEAFRDTDTRTVNYNFGPTNNDGAQLRINQAFWDALQSIDASRPWRPYYEGKEGQIGHVRVRLSDQLMREMRDRLIQLGYIDGRVESSVADGSAFSDALKRYYTEAREQNMPVGSWAGWTETGGCASYDVFGTCQNYGPNTDGDQIRLHTDLLDSIVNRRHSPRVTFAMRGAQTGVAATRTKPPLIGSLPGDASPMSTLNASVGRRVPIAPSTTSKLIAALRK